MAILSFGCSAEEPRDANSMGGMAGQTTVRSDRDLSDISIEREIERIVALRSAAENGDAAARSALGPALDAREADLWSKLRAVREASAFEALRHAGLLDGAGRVQVAPEILEAHLHKLVARLAVAESALSSGVLPVELGRVSAQMARRERAQIVAELAVVRGLLAQNR